MPDADSGPITSADDGRSGTGGTEPCSFPYTIAAVTPTGGFPQRRKGRPPGPAPPGDEFMITTRNIAFAAIVALGAATSLSSPTFAAHNNNNNEVGGRMENQRDRIEQGYENGSLTKNEACRLLSQEKDLHKDRQHMAKNGMNENEREQMNRDLNRESNRIHAQRTDDQDSGHKGRNIKHLDC
jgi:hypothetical protein